MFISQPSTIQLYCRDRSSSSSLRVHPLGHCASVARTVGIHPHFPHWRPPPQAKALLGRLPKYNRRFLTKLCRMLARLDAEATGHSLSTLAHAFRPACDWHWQRVFARERETESERDREHGTMSHHEQLISKFVSQTLSHAGRGCCKCLLLCRRRDCKACCAAPMAPKRFCKRKLHK